jgi:hypothetical protein
MKQYGELSEKELNDLYESRRTVSVLVPDSVAKVKGVLAASHHPADDPEYAEVAPSPVVLGDKEAHAVYGSHGDSLESRWLRTVVLLYRLGGRVLYREATGDMIEAKLDFRHARPK